MTSSAALASASSSASAAATDATLQDNTVFFADMEGMTHAINTATGVEVFSFLPRETLLREPTVIMDGTQTLPEFGLDLTPTVYRRTRRQRKRRRRRANRSFWRP